MDLRTVMVISTSDLGYTKIGEVEPNFCRLPILNVYALGFSLLLQGTPRLLQEVAFELT